ncbi:CoA pyrophosphatase [Microbacterium sp. BWT-B31]|uniref:NUDIX hydrolase n=1 Tax=Microbacterium sp. BWT-B31 TaxID=3232072 RepID=UPI003526F904
MTDPFSTPREQLEALAVDPELLASWPREGVDPAVAKSAAVLVLFGARDGVEVTNDPYDLDLLLLARATTLRSHAGQVAFPGGRSEDSDEDIVATALREAQEETGLDPAGVDVLGVLRPLPLAYSLHVVTPVLGWWRHPSPVAVGDAAESSAVFRTPVADLISPERRYTSVIHRDGQTWKGPAWVLDADGAEQILWGFTGLIVDSILDRLGWAQPWDATRTILAPV